MNEETLICLDCEKVLPEDDYGRSYGHRNCNVVTMTDAKLIALEDVARKPHVQKELKRCDYELEATAENGIIFVEAISEELETVKAWVYDPFGKELTK